MSKGKLFPVLTGLLALGFLAPTADAQAPVGTYELTEVNGDALPVPIEVEDDCTEEVNAAELTLAEQGEWTLQVTSTETCGTEVEEETDTESGTYTTEAEAIVFLDDDGEREEEERDEDEIEVDELDSAVLQGSTLQVTLADRETRLTFERI